MIVVFTLWQSDRARWRRPLPFGDCGWAGSVCRKPQPSTAWDPAGWQPWRAEKNINGAQQQAPLLLLIVRLRVRTFLFFRSCKFVVYSSSALQFIKLQSVIPIKLPMNTPLINLFIVPEVNLLIMHQPISKAPWMYQKNARLRRVCLYCK